MFLQPRHSGGYGCKTEWDMQRKAHGEEKTLATHWPYPRPTLYHPTQIMCYVYLSDHAHNSAEAFTSILAAPVFTGYNATRPKINRAPTTIDVSMPQSQSPSCNQVHNFTQQATNSAPKTNARMHTWGRLTGGSHNSSPSFNLGTAPPSPPLATATPPLARARAILPLLLLTGA